MVHNRVMLASLLVGVTGVVACTTVRRVQPAQFFATNSPDVVWVTYTNGTIVPVAQPEIAGDTLRGMRQGTRERVALPLDQVRSVRAKMPNVAKTALLATTLGVASVSAVYFMWVAKAGPDPSGVQCGVYGSARDGDPVGAPLPYC
jgi:hypothetical protein